MGSTETVRQLLDQLQDSQQVSLKLHGFEIRMSWETSNDLFKLSTIVYQAHNYLPPSVRSIVLGKHPAPASPLKGVLRLDEALFHVELSYSLVDHTLTEVRIAELLEEFSWLAEQWRRVFDEHDRRDLVYVPVR